MPNRQTTVQLSTIFFSSSQTSSWSPAPACFITHVVSPPCFSRCDVSLCRGCRMHFSVDMAMKVTSPFSLFLSAKSSCADPPHWGFPEGQPHRERLLWAGVSEHADELGTYTGQGLKRHSRISRKGCPNTSFIADLERCAAVCLTFTSWWHDTSPSAGRTP